MEIRMRARTEAQYVIPFIGASLCVRWEGWDSSTRLM